jgi:hypothetical protein
MITYGLPFSVAAVVVVIVVAVVVVLLVDVASGSTGS